MTVCLPISLWFALPTSTGSQQGGALLLLIHVARGFYIAITYPPRYRWGLLAIVYRLLAFVYRSLAFVYRLLAIVYRLLATVYRLPLTLLLLLPLTRLLTISRDFRASRRCLKDR